MKNINKGELNMTSYKEEQQIRWDVPQVGYAPYRQVHAHSTGNPRSTAQNEADYVNNKDDITTGFYSHVVGNGRVIQVTPVGQGAYDVGGGWNYETFASVELLESHGTYAEFRKDYEIYIQLLRDLAIQGDIPLTLDTDDLEGIKTHYFCTNNQPNNFSDHIDPLPYLAKWGIDFNQFKHDIENGIDGVSVTTDTAHVGIMTEIVKTTENKLHIRVTHHNSVSMKEGTEFSIYLVDEESKHCVGCKFNWLEGDVYNVILPFEKLGEGNYKLYVEVHDETGSVPREIAWYKYVKTKVDYGKGYLIVNDHRAFVQRKKEVVQVDTKQIGTVEISGKIYKIVE